MLVKSRLLRCRPSETGQMGSKYPAKRLQNGCSTPCFDTFLPTWRTCVRCGKWSYNHFWEGALWPNGHPSGRKRRQQGKSVTFVFWGRKPLNPPLSAVIGSYPPLSSEPYEKRVYLCIGFQRERCRRNDNFPTPT